MTSALYPATIALGAFLLFLVEPLAARLLLPRFGGTSAVWLTSLLFFQVALLAGYLFADAVVRRARRQPALHLTLLAAAAASLPFTLPLTTAQNLPAMLTRGPPALQLLGLLLVSVGMPFIALAATGPLVQALWSKERAGSPYRLYALSNLASLLGLAAYPFLVEPRLTLHAQVRLFCVAFALFALSAALLSLRARRASNAEAPPEVAPAEATSRRAQLLWLLLPACTSALLLSITGHLTRNVAPIPLLWMLPLAAYLLSFILCFDSPRWVKRVWSAPAAIGSLAGLAWIDGWIPPVGHLVSSLLVITSAFFLCVTSLHGELVRLRPPPARLTRFYLSISLGGALGSIFVAVLVPLLFHSTVELALSIVASAIALSVAWFPELKARPRFSLSSRAALVIASVTMALCLFLAARIRAKGNIFASRNFYGALRVQERNTTRGWTRVLYNGTTMHGVELIDPLHAREMLAYYGPTSGVGRALTAERGMDRPLRVGVIGLGAGILAGACEPRDVFSLYEINPLVVRIAREQFQFLQGCPDAQVKLGDARLLLAQEAPQAFDLLVIDAFNSDAIPVHLLTKEAFALYARHLAPSGIIAVHVSNRYLDLDPPILAHLKPLGMTGLLLLEETNHDELYPNEWFLVSRDPKALDGDAYDDSSYIALEGEPVVREWTDDYSNIAGAFR